MAFVAGDTERNSPVGSGDADADGNPFKGRVPASRANSNATHDARWGQVNRHTRSGSKANWDTGTGNTGGGTPVPGRLLEERQRYRGTCRTGPGCGHSHHGR